MRVSRPILQIIIIFLTSVSASFAVISDESWKIFDDSSVGEVRILIEPAYLAYILNPANAESDSLFPAILIFKNAVISGDTLNNIGFRIRGNTSRYSAKKSFSIDINYFVPGRQFYDLEKINLNGEHNDPSIIRSKLCWDLFNTVGIPASRASHVKLYINNEYRGLYINVEHIDDEFVQKRFGNQNGNLYKCLWPADLVYLGENQELYKQEHNGRRAYDLKTNTITDDYSDLVHFIDVINNTPQPLLQQELEKIFNIDSFLKWLALNVLVGSWDDYWYLKNNYYLYHNTATDKFEFIPYDYDNTYGIDWVGPDWGTRNVYQWGNTWEARPLVTRILSVPEYNYDYTQHLSIYMDNEFAIETQQPRIDQLKDMITPAAEADYYRTLDWDFSIADFHLSFIDSVATVRHHVPYGIEPYIQTRIATARSQLTYINLPPDIALVEHSPRWPEPNQPVYITAEVSDNDPLLYVRLFWRTTSSNFQAIVMYDDGNHHDGAANDGKFGAQTPQQSEGTVIYYYVEAQDNRHAFTMKPAAAPQNAFYYVSHQAANADVPIQLHFTRSLKPGDTGVGLLGSFNGWNKIYPMTHAGSDRWEISILLAPGSYIYKFVTFNNLNGQSGVTEWIADPENPERDGPPYFNAVLNVTDPMIYYIKPLDQDTIFTNQPAISANFTSSRNTTINSNSIIFKIDGNPINNAGYFYDPNNYQFQYLPSAPLTQGMHAINFYVQNSQGNSIEKNSEFFISNPLLFINEFMASNNANIFDEYGETDDWIEIYNGDNVAINLNGMFLTDDLDRSQRWMLPDRTIAPGEFLLIWADGDTSQGPLHANFKLSAAGEQIGLFASLAMGNVPIDTLGFGPQSTNISYGRYPDGGLSWQFYNRPTPGRSNLSPINSAPVITEVSHVPLSPGATDTVWITARITDDSNLNTVNLEYFLTPANIFLQLMYDDGRHHDGAANDSVYGGKIQPFPDKSLVHYFIIAKDDSSAISKNPANAPDSTLSYQVGYEPLLLFINEFMADNSTNISDENGEFDDWIEIYNQSNQSINLNGKFLSDDFTDPRQWQFPDVFIEPHGYLLVWTDGDQDQGALHTNFRLERNGEQLGIFESDLLGNAPIDTFSFGPQYADTSWGRYPDGGNAWDYLPPTPGHANRTYTDISVSDNLVPARFELWQNYPNPFNAETEIKYQLPQSCQVTIEIYNSLGQKIRTMVDKVQPEGFYSVVWDGRNEQGISVTSGIYLYLITANQYHEVKKMLLLR